MSPEQARGKAIDGRTDVYALGCLAHKMLTGQLPFKGDNAMDLIVQQLNTPPPNPLKLAPKTPPELARLVVRMMAKNPEERPSLVEIRDLFAKIASTAPPTADAPRRAKPISTTFGDSRPEQDRPRKRTDERPTERRPDPAPAPRRRATGALVGVMVLLAAVIGVAVFLLKKQQSSTPSPNKDAVTLTVSAEAVPTGSAAGSAVATEQPTIEFDPDPMRTGSGAGSAKHHHHHKQTGSDSEAGDVADEPAAPPPNKPGAIIITLEHASTISIDGMVVAQSSQGGRYDVTPGHHEILVKASDRAPISRTVDLDPGATAFLKIADDKGGATETPPAPKPDQPAPTP
jgi:serine/threonine protein kinase